MVALNRCFHISKRVRALPVQTKYGKPRITWFVDCPDCGWKATGKAAFDVLYQEYLQSDNWASLRDRVMERAGGLCEGCRYLPATQVHHTTYDRVFGEMLFDLVALCEDCHRDIHSNHLEVLRKV